MTDESRCEICGSGTDIKPVKIGTHSEIVDGEITYTRHRDAAFCGHCRKLVDLSRDRAIALKRRFDEQ